MKNLEVGENLLPAIAYGDACGLPFETRPANEISSIGGLSSIRENQYLDIPKLLKNQKGIWSDDTHLSIATALSLINSQGFNLKDMAEHHVRAIKCVRGLTIDDNLMPAIVTASKRNGYGKSTVESIDRIAEGIDPKISGNDQGSGNGVLMKMAPLVLWSVSGMSKELSDDDVVQFTKMTHASTESIVTSLVHRKVLESLYFEDFDNKDVYDYAYEEALTYEKQLKDKKRTVSNMLGKFIGKRIGYQEIIDSFDDKSRAGLYAPETLMMAYGSFHLESEFPKSVYRAVELGGDTDSVASIVGAMSVFQYGEVDFPDDIEDVFAIDRLRRTSDSFAKSLIEKGQ